MFLGSGQMLIRTVQKVEGKEGINGYRWLEGLKWTKIGLNMLFQSNWGLSRGVF